MNRNIETRTDVHKKWCHQSTGSDRTDDVRICKHGKIQINESVLGLIGGTWRDLSPIWDPIKYKRAKRVLLADEVVEEQPHQLADSIVHLYYDNNDLMQAPICVEVVNDEWVKFDHTAVGKICPDCQNVIGRKVS